MEQQPSKTEQFYLKGKKVEELTFLQCKDIIRLINTTRNINNVNYSEWSQLTTLMNKLTRQLKTLERELLTVRINSTAGNYKQTLTSIEVVPDKIINFFYHVFKSVKRIKL